MTAVAHPAVGRSGRILAFQPPSHWDVKPLRYLFDAVGGATPSKDNISFWDGRIPWVSPKDMKSDVIRDSEDHISDSALNETRLALLPTSTVLVVVRGMILLHTIPIAITAVETTINQDMKGLFAKSGILPEYLAHLIRAVSPVLFSTVEESGHGTRCLRLDLWREILVGIPPKEEQRWIVDYVDRRSDQVDTLIGKKQRQIELLQEKRQALISQVVTKGVDLDVPMRHSGIEWLGPIPAHWWLTRLKFVAEIQTGLTLGKRYGDETLVSRPYLRVANVQDGYLDLTEITQVGLPAQDVARYELKPGDVLMTEGGDYDKLGRGFVWEGQIEGCLHQNHVFAVRPATRKLDSHYLSCLMTSSHGKAYFTSTSQQTTNLASTNSTKLGDFPLPLPPIEEQQTILLELMRYTTVVDRQISLLRSSIEKFREYRQALITAAVTGKLDVMSEAS